jgi:crotonobetainyl-CoA:carnitine CoA-transferase CaiB-like acyl-CoA transferase
MILEGVRIIDWTGFLVGPVAGAMLGDLGAEVVKVEQMGRGDPLRGLRTFFGVPLDLPHGRHAAFEHHNRNKRGMAIDLESPKGREVMYRLVQKADVFLTNFRPKACARLGLDYDTLRQHNPKLIYARGSGFGEKGPDSELPSIDLIPQARSGIMMASGEPDMPPVHISTGMADSITAIMLAYGVVSALLGRERTGTGQMVTVSQLGSMIALQGFLTQLKFFPGLDFPRHDRNLPTNPLYNYYKCQDGRWIALALILDRHWPLLCQAVGLTEMEKAPQFEDTGRRKENRQELTAILDRIFATKPYSEWERVFREADLIFGPIQDIADLPNDPQVVENEYVIDFDHPYFGKVQYPGFPVHFSETPASLKMAAPEFGQHTEEVLLENGYTWEDIAELGQQGVI